jgi:hypothetical protein
VWGNPPRVQIPVPPRGSTGIVAGSVEFLSDEWCALLAAEGALLPRHPGATVSQEMTLYRADGTERTYTLYFVDGAIDRVTPAADPGADVRSRYPEEVWAPFCEGNPDPMERAILSGKARSVADSDRAYLAADISADDLRAVLERVHSRTRYT